MEFKLLRQITILLPLLGFLCVPVNAQERPWGRVDNSVKSPDSSNAPSGYLGRYNPWGNKQDNGSPEVTEQPRYREPQSHNAQSYRAAPSGNPWGYPQQRPAYPYSSPYDYGMPYGNSYPGGMGMPGLAPWFGGINPGYGNYWNDPYETMRPDTGLLWSDMWRW